MAGTKSKRSRGGSKAMGKSRKRAVGAVVRRVVRGMAENKYVDQQMLLSSGAGQNMTSNWTMLRVVDGTPTALTRYLNAMAGGSSQSQRVGVKVAQRYVELKIQCDVASGFATRYPGGFQLKFALVLDRLPSQVADPTTLASTIWFNSFPNNKAFTAQRNHDQVERFRVLREWVMPMVAGMVCPCTIKAFIPLKGMHTEFTGSTIDWGDTMKNALSLWYCGTSDGVNAADFIIRATSRTVYKDV